MKEFYLSIPPKKYSDLQKHLLPRIFTKEEVAFLFLHRRIEPPKEFFEYLDVYRVPPGGFETRSGFYLELSDESRALVIKRAHDLNASLAEFHSHLGTWPARFSPSDREGFREFVPHVLWRLKGRPYLAVVVAQSGFDGLVWATGPNSPDRLSGIMVGTKILRPTGLTPLYESIHETE